MSLICLGAVLFAVSLINKRSRKSLTIPTVLLAVISGSLLFFTFETSYEKTVSFVGENVIVSGEIAERPTFSRENERYYCVVRVQSVNGNSIRTKIRLSFSETKDEINPSELHIGDKISFSGTVYKIGVFSSSSKNYYKSQGIYLGAYSIKNLKITKPEYRSVGYYIDNLRQKVVSSLLHDFDNENASLLVALLTGNKDHMSDDLYEDFIRAGIVHIMAVSGLHLSIWVAFFSYFMDFRGRKGKFLSVIMIVFTLFMMNFAYFTGSVKRASAMTLLYFIGKLFRKKTRPLNSLGFAAVFALVPNPFGVLDISFMLSFLSTLGIILMGIPLSDKIISKLNILGETGKKILSPLVVTVALSVSVTFFIFPISVIVFGGASFISPITNLLTFAAVSPLLLITGFYTVFRFTSLISPFMATMMKYLSAYIIRVAEFTSEIPFAYVNTGFERLGLWFIVSFAFLVIAMLLYNYDRVLMRVAALFSSGVFLLSFSVNFYTSLDKCKITVYGEGEGSCAVVSLNGKGVLIGFDGDIYDEKNIAEDAERDSVKIECAVFTEEFIDKDKESLCCLLGINAILTEDNENVCLFDKVKITKSGKNVTVDSSEIKTEIFYKEYLQDEDKYDTIAYNSEKLVFTLREKYPYTITVITSGGEKDG